MRYRWRIILVFLVITIKGFPQSELLSTSIIAKLDSVRMRANHESHFAELYCKATLAADQYIQSLSGTGQALMARLERNFAEYFFRAVKASDEGALIPPEWKNYFNGKRLSSLQLKLMGANAHINGDIWQAMVASFSLGELKQLAPVYKDYNRSLDKLFDDLFSMGKKSHKRLRDLHVITLGLDKVYGRMMMRKWRNRQFKLAVLNLSHNEKFNKMKGRTDVKRVKIDKMIIRWLRQSDAPSSF